MLIVLYIYKMTIFYPDPADIYPQTNWIEMPPTRLDNLNRDITKIICDFLDYDDQTKISTLSPEMNYIFGAPRPDQPLFGRCTVAFGT